MQAITVRFIGPTNYRGARLKAECARGSITIPYPYAGDHMNTALVALIRKFMREDAESYGTPPQENPWRGPWVQGGTKDGNDVFVHVNEPLTVIPE